jgi:hypothetical protein
MIGILALKAERSCVRAYAFAALRENPPADRGTARIRLVSSARVATIISCEGNFRATSRRGMDSPANISVCFSELILTMFKALIASVAGTLPDPGMQHRGIVPKAHERPSLRSFDGY